MMAPTLTPETFSAIMRKSKSLFSVKKYEEALDVMILIQEDVENFSKLSDYRLLAFYNNVGVLYYFLRKTCLSCFYFNKAYQVYLFHVFRCSDQVNTQRSGSLHSDGIYKIIYNIGVCMLFRMKLKEAFFYLREAAQGMHRSPLIWLRLAECCIMIYKRDQEGELSALINGNLLANSKVGSGLSSKIVLNGKFWRDSGYSSNPCKTRDGDRPSLGFASICLKNSYLLLPEGRSALKEAVLAATSYVHLTLGNPLVAHKYAKMLAEDSCHTDKYLSKLYLAESLVLLNRIEEAIELLKTTYVNDYDSFDNLNDYWFSNIETTSHYILNYNLIVSLLLNGQFYEASKVLRTFLMLKLSVNKVPIHIVALALYIELATGHVDAARSIIKQQCPQLFQ